MPEGLRALAVFGKVYVRYRPLIEAESLVIVNGKVIYAARPQGPRGSAWRFHATSSASAVGSWLPAS